MAGEQSACSPATVVASLSYKPGWSFKIAGPLGSKLCVFARTPDSLNPAQQRTTQHQFDLPPPCDEREFLRWVRDCLLLAERHECCEFLAVNGHRPFFPNHQGEDPYVLVERWEP